MKRYIGFGMIAVPFAALLIAGVPEIFHQAKTIPLGAWESAGTIFGASSVYVVVARHLMRSK